MPTKAGPSPSLKKAWLPPAGGGDAARLIPLLLELPHTGPNQILPFSAGDSAWDFSAGYQKSSGPHKNGFRSVLYTDFHVQSAYYAFNDPTFAGTINDPFVWNIPDNPY
jgi:hypothetical protein